MTLQTPEIIINQVKSNLRSVQEMGELRKQAEHVVKYLSDNGFGALATELTEMFSKQGTDLSFSESDFGDSTVYPDEDFSEEYTKKHTLSPLSFGVYVEQPRWYALARKLGFDPTQREQSFDKSLFQKSIMSLDKLGISLHVDRGRKEDLEFTLLRQDSGLYSSTHERGRRLEPRKLLVPEYAIMTFEYLILSDMAAHRAEPDAPQEVITGYLVNRVNSFISLTPHWLGVPGHLTEETILTYETIMGETIDRIPEAVDSMYWLQAEIGDGLLTPVMFSLGSTENELALNHLLSPLIGIKKFRDYTESGEIKPEQIKQIIVDKGYVI